MTGQDLLSIELKLTRGKIRVALNNLKITNEITIKSSKQGSIIQLVKYNDYQVVTNKQPTEQPLDNQSTTTNKNNKEIKEDNKPPKTAKKFIHPTKVEFMLYAKSKLNIDVYNKSKKKLEWKFDAWEVDDWKDGNGVKIKNWKSKLIHNLTYITS